MAEPKDYAEYDEAWGARSSVSCDACGSPIWMIGVCVCRRGEKSLYGRLVACEGLTPEQARSEDFRGR